jgi:hypothetical protein
MTYNLRIPIEDCILFPVSGAQLKFFRAKTRPENAVWMLGTEVGALFRFKEDDFADIRDIADATPNQRYTQARMMFDKLAAGDLAPELQHPCLKCTFVHRQQHLKEYLASNPHAKQGHR